MKLDMLAVAAFSLVWAHSAVAGSRATSYSLTDLGDLPTGADWSEAAALNELGHVVGTSRFGNSDRAFFWSPSDGMVNLGDLDGGFDHSEAFALNDHDEVVGLSNVGGSLVNSPFYWSSATGMLNLSALSGSASQSGSALGINNARVVTGRRKVGSNSLAFRWTASSGYTTLNDLPGGAASSTAVDINDAGIIAGSGTNATAGHAVRWTTPSAVLDLGDIPGGLDQSHAAEINNLGHIVGYSYGAAGQTTMLWTPDTGMIDLGTLDGGLPSAAEGINDHGVIVGWAFVPEGRRAVVWTSAGQAPIDLNSVLDGTGSGWTLLEAVAINNSGLIAANAINAAGVTHAVLLTPVPAPGAAGLFAPFVLFTGARRRRETDAV